MNNSRSLLIAAILLLAITLGCGGGGSSSGGSNNPVFAPPTVSANQKLKEAIVGVPYSDKLIVTGGQPPLTFGASYVPAGLTLNTSTGEISGTPTGPDWGGAYFTVRDGLDRIANGVFTLDINTPLVIMSPNPVLGHKSVAYTYTFPLQNAYGPGYSNPQTSVTAGTLPPGLTFNGLSLAGIPTQSGNFPFTLKVSVGSNPPQVSEKQFSIDIDTALWITSTKLKTAVQGSPYADTIQTVNGTAPYSFTANNLPQGLTISAAGVVSGTPITPDGSYASITVTDSSTPQQSHIESVLIPVNRRLAADSNYMPDGVVQGQYPYGFNAYGGLAPYTFSISSGTVPPGLSILQEPEYNRISFRGTLTTSGKYDFTVQVTDSEQPPVSIQQNTSIIVTPPYLKIDTTQLPPARIGVSYSAALQASGGEAPYTFKLQNGSTLPGGLVLDTDGTISGTPAEAIGESPSFVVTGSFPYRVQTNSAAVKMVVGLAPGERNDSLAKSVRLRPGAYRASLSPDWDDDSGIEGDIDVYRVVLPGNRNGSLSVQSTINNSGHYIFPLIEILNPDGTPYTNCNNGTCVYEPTSIYDGWVSAYVNNSTSTDAELYIRVRDARGLARPDTQYQISISSDFK